MLDGCLRQPRESTPPLPAHPLSHTATYCLDRVREKDQEAGLPVYTKIDVPARVREDGWAED
ncbi:hypothetical protein GCM10022285_53340 [Streptomyces tunisiensis]|uniref:Uncharacterized protein n=1 Tax=Streptomyces tunisiensis TaxID=948699 RepID=A0ABP7Z422_9ACTN